MSSSETSVASLPEPSGPEGAERSDGAPTPPRFLNFLPVPSLRVQWWLALANLICQMGIATTGVTVRVTASGLGCPTWPQCHPGSFVPLPGGDHSTLHQVIEFGNRLLTFVLVSVAIALFVALLRAGRRRELLVLGLIMPGGVLLQGVIGGITVLSGLAWWTVALHLLATMLLTWFAALLFVRVREPDDGTPVRVASPALRWLAGLGAAALAVVLVTGTMVTGAGPHAGDDRITPDERLQIDITALTQVHSLALMVYLALLLALVAGVVVTKVRGPILRRLGILVGLVVLQAVVGITQFLIGVPEALVVLHVTLATILTAVTSSVFAATRLRERAPQPEDV